jgi:hypothetical protein
MYSVARAPVYLTMATFAGPLITHMANEGIAHSCTHSPCILTHHTASKLRAPDTFTLLNQRASNRLNQGCFQTPSPFHTLNQRASNRLNHGCFQTPSPFHTLNQLASPTFHTLNHRGCLIGSTNIQTHLQLQTSLLVKCGACRRHHFGLHLPLSQGSLPL